MQWYEFVFSEKKGKRLLRHWLFWMAWWLYLLFRDYLYLQNVTHSTADRGYVVAHHYVFIKTFLLILIYAAACYVIIYFLMPQLIKGTWAKSVLSLLLLFTILYIAAHLMYWTIFPFVDSLFGSNKSSGFINRYWPAIYLGLIDPVKIIASACIIKCMKYWWQKKQESEKLEREKISAELQLLRAQLHPDFLLTTLDNIYVYSKAASPHTPELLLRLSDLLSYMLYESNSLLVPLEREIAMMEEYMKMEKIRLSQSFEMGLTIRGDLRSKMIAPFVIFPFIENSIKQSSIFDKNGWINLDISIEGNWLFMKLANGIAPETVGLLEAAANHLSTIRRRLTLIYPEHELKICREQEMCMVSLKLKLSNTPAFVAEEDEEPSLVEF